MNSTFALGGRDSVGRMGFGTMKLPAWPTGRQPDHDTALAVLRRAVELGVNHIDTSGFYVREGVSANALIKEALYPYPEDLVLVTKVGPRFGDNQPLPYATPAQLREDVEANLSELGVDRIGGVNLRAPGFGVRSDEPIGPHFEALAALREEGLIEHLGLSSVTAERVAEARAIAPVACVQNHYNLVHREDDEALDGFAADGIAYVPFFPLGGHVDSAFLEHDRLQLVAKRHQMSPAQVALAWLLARSPNILLIPGTSSVAHLEDNVAAARIELSAQDLADLTAVK